MSAFNDARCSCGKRFGWVGKLTDKPPCPKCGKKDDMASLLKEQEEMDRFEDELFNRLETELLKDEDINVSENNPS